MAIPTSSQATVDGNARLSAEATQKALRISESRYRRLFEAAQDGILLLNADTAQIEDVNPYLIHMLGYSHDEFLGKKLWEVGPFADIAQSKEMFVVLQEKGYVRYDDLPLKTKSGAVVPVEFVSNAYDCEGIRVIQCNIRNMSGRHADRAKILRFTQLYATLSQCNKAIVHCQTEAELFQRICTVAVEFGGMKMAWVGMVNAETLQLTPAASFGDDTAYLAHVAVSVDASTPLGQGPSGLAIRSKQPVWCQDFLTDPITTPWHEAAALAGLASSATLPLFKSGTVVGAITLFAGEAHAFGEDTRDLLMEMADDISFALNQFASEALRRKIEADIVYLNRVYAMLSAVNTLIVRTDSREDLFEQACRIAVDGGFSMAMIAIVDPKTRKLVPMASQGKDAALMGAIRSILSSGETAAKTMGARAIQHKQVVVSNQSQLDPQVVFRARYTELGIRSMAVFPLIVSDAAVGVFALYASEVDFFHGEELKLLTELAGDIAFAIDHLEKQERLTYLAFYDGLTGLANQSLFLERVAQSSRSALSAGHKLAIVLMDLERFKNINDSLGRPAGDELLKKVAHWLTRYVGDANRLARLGADRFAVLMPVVMPEDDVGHLLGKMMTAFLAHPFRLNDAIFRIAAKAGVALFPDDGADTDTLFRNAEAALKKAKSSGQRHLFYTQSMNEMVAGKLTMENQLRQALQLGEFVLHYQPKVNLVSGKMTSAEALIRWNRPGAGLVPPGQFVPVLEEIGLINEVGRWALHQANADYLRWHTAGLAPVRIAVNVSALQLRNRTFFDEVRQLVESDGRTAAGLELEITESLIMEDVNHSINSLQAIRALGLTIAIDDFGTGFSSLSYLSKLPVDTLKIDRSFVVDMTAAPEGLALVSTIISLAHALKLHVVAEGVETDEQARLLRLLSCDDMQGFLFSRPVPADAFEAQFLAPRPLALTCQSNQ